ncbi:MAG: ribonuclease J [Halieaceae bacterium]|nr:ribonuclease J [Halieaceae bacterium]
MSLNPGKNDTWFLPLGGCGEIGMNLNLFGHNGRWLMVDCGITFEHPEGSPTGRPSIQMPDPQFIASRRQLLDGLIITHAHEDHLGAVPYLWSDLKCPVYTTPFTAAVLRRKNAWRGGELPPQIIEVEPGETHTLGEFRVRWLPITHSTPETCALVIETRSTRVLHTADWKIDHRPVVGPAWQQDQFARLGSEGVDAVICDSTNAPKPGRSPTEGDVADGLLQTIAPLTGRVVVASFASNVARIQSVLRIAHATGRRVGLLGRSLENMWRCARGCGLIDPDFQPIDAGHLGYLPDNEVLALATGSQGEIGAALHRLMMDSHPHLSLGEGDTVILSSKTIPGNEASVARVVEGLRERGVSVIQAEHSKRTLHASGHPCAQELTHLFETVQPGLVIPVHGEDVHMRANGQIARQSGVSTVLTGHNGDLFYLSPTPGIRRRWAPVGRLEWLERERKLVPVADA